MSNLIVSATVTESRFAVALPWHVRIFIADMGSTRKAEAFTPCDHCFTSEAAAVAYAVKTLATFTSAGNESRGFRVIDRATAEREAAEAAAARAIARKAAARKAERESEAAKAAPAVASDLPLSDTAA